MRSLFEVGLRLVGAAVLCWAIEPIANLASVLSLPTIPRSGQVMSIHTFVSTGLYLMVGLWLLICPGILCRLVSDRGATTEPQVLPSARSVLHVGLILIGIFYLLPAIKDLAISISQMMRPAAEQAGRLNSREAVRGLVGAVVSILLIVGARGLAAWGSPRVSGPVATPPQGSGQRQRR